MPLGSLRAYQSLPRGADSIEIGQEGIDGARTLRHEAEDGAGQDRLALAGGPDEAEDLAPLHGKGNVVKLGPARQVPHLQRDGGRAQIGDADAFLADLAAMGALVWSLLVTWRIWRRRDGGGLPRKR